MSYSTRDRESLTFHPHWEHLRPGETRGVILLSTSDGAAFNTPWAVLHRASAFFRDMGRVQLPWPVPEGHVVVLELPGVSCAALEFGLSALACPEVWRRDVLRPRLFGAHQCAEIVTFAVTYGVRQALRSLHDHAQRCYHASPKHMFRSPRIFDVFTIAVLVNDLKAVTELEFSLYLLARAPNEEQDAWSLATLLALAPKAYESLRLFFEKYYAALDALLTVNISHDSAFGAACNNDSCPNFIAYDGDYPACVRAHVAKAVEMLKHDPRHALRWTETYGCGSECNLCARDINRRVSEVVATMPEEVFLFSYQRDN